MRSANLVFICLYFLWVLSVVVCGGFIPFIPRILVSYEDRICSQPLGDRCVEITKCKFFTDLLDKTPIPRPRSIVKIIRDHQCGFENNTPKVCCLAHQTTTTTTTTTSTTTTTTIRTPRQVLPNEPIFFDSLTDDLEYHENYHLLPLDQCGPIPREMLVNRITSGKKTALEEFPWMALIAYNTTGVGVEFRCGGTIINENHVLTAAHCILNSTLIGVRLGEYDLSSTQQDCEGSYCAPPVQDFYIKETVIHPKYNPKTLENDIAILRLTNRANFSYSNVKPICLPVSEMNDDLTGKFAIVSGWGVTEDDQKSSVLLKASVPVHPIATCRKVYQRYFPLTKNQICAGGHKGQDSCAGDSGGPLTYTGLVEGSPRYIQYGIVSFGPRRCGANGQPGIYTRVGSYLHWLLDNLTPYYD